MNTSIDYRNTEFEKHHKLLILFLKREILTDVDGGLRRSVAWLYKENGKLLDRCVELGGKELEKEFWDNWALDDEF